MEFFTQLLDGIKTSPAATMLVLALLALAYFYKAREADWKASVERISVMEAAHRDTIAKVIPLSEKLIESVALLERLMSKGAV